ncbi:kinase-like domain-containing protein [Rhizophagus clarus]|uniref:Kinase-like domain-containing protein n=1 Tax=Rhizophagus clarus TaxID=94130 RepID=A0A8H3R4N8_9GLOM|nr:kinase-like domain-containing protein [Rhizophagus clarus]
MIEGLVECIKCSIAVYHNVPILDSCTSSKTYLIFVADYLKPEIPLYLLFFSIHRVFGFGFCVECGSLFKDETLWCNYCHLKRFQDNYITSGGFSKVYRANWIHGQILSWNNHDRDYIRNKNMLVALKELNNSSNICDDFLKELKLSIQFNNNPYTLKLLGISQNSKTKNYILVTKFMKRGSLSTMIFKKKITSWLEKLILIQKISEGIKSNHDAGYLHCDIHSGNLFYENTSKIYINDFGIRMPAYKVIDNNGVSPAYRTTINFDNNGVITAYQFISECILGTSLFQKSFLNVQILMGLGILYWEIITQKKAFASERNDVPLGLRICGRECLRPKIEDGTPKHLKELIESCWDAGPQKRPSIEYINSMISSIVFYLVNTRKDLVEELRLKSQAEENQINNQSQNSQNPFANKLFSKTLISKNTNFITCSTIFYFENINGEFQAEKLPLKLRAEKNEISDQSQVSKIQEEESEINDQSRDLFINKLELNLSENLIYTNEYTSESQTSKCINEEWSNNSCQISIYMGNHE